MSVDTEKKRFTRLPEWLKTSKGKLAATKKLAKTLEAEVPNSICQEARCPNRSECFDKGVLTFMILGITCTRNCAFCSVTHGTPLPPNKNELDGILNAIEKLKLRFVVLTSPNRDDLPDGGAAHYQYIVRGIKAQFPDVKVEVLIPDFQGDTTALATVIEAQPDVINHNMETVPARYSVARKGSVYHRSLDVLAVVKQLDRSRLTKSGLMVGLGETTAQLHAAFADIKNVDVDILTVGQYLQPTQANLPVEKYYTPAEFVALEQHATSLGFPFVFAGPMVRSSYLADVIFDKTTHHELRAKLK